MTEIRARRVLLLIACMASAASCIDRERPASFTFFTAAWCQNCKAMEYEWRVMSSQLQASGLALTTSLVDCEREVAMCERESVASVPAIRYRKGEEKEEEEEEEEADKDVSQPSHVYLGWRDAASLLEFARGLDAGTPAA